MSTANAVLGGDRLALSRLLTQIENNTPEGQDVLDELFPHTGRAHLIGVTGGPGTGKSSLVNQLANRYRHPPDGRPPLRVAIVAVDPTSPFTGGALLGDRIRMRDLAGDPGVFIRSMATRGALGGLAQTTSRVVEVFDAAGYDLIFIETVGAGQVEVEVARLAHTTIVVEAPGLGDDVQAIKAGILEVADILVVNKSDRPGADQTVRALRQMLALAHPAPKIFHHHGWIPAEAGTGGTPTEPPRKDIDGNGAEIWFPLIVQTAATEGEGIDKLVEAIERHSDHLDHTGERHLRDRAHLADGLESLLRDSLIARWRAGADPVEVGRVFDRLFDRTISPAQAIGILLDGELEG